MLIKMIQLSDYCHSTVDGYPLYGDFLSSTLHKNWICVASKSLEGLPNDVYQDFKMMMTGYMMMLAAELHFSHGHELVAAMSDLGFTTFVIRTPDESYTFPLSDLVE